MNPSFERGRILYLQRRFDLAAREFRRAIHFEPGHPFALAMLALCLCELKRHKEADATARQAIGASSDNAFCHYALAHCLFRRNQFKQAREAIRESIRLDPDVAMSYGQSALIEFNDRRWQAALEIARQGLRLDPTDISSNIALVHALDYLGRKAESKAAAQNLLRLGPEDEYAHANTGWSYLHYGDYVRSLEHFREALRINPNMQPAQQGFIEALKCRMVVYRLARRLGTWFTMQRDRPLTVVTAILWIIFLAPLTVLSLSLLFVRPLLAPLIRLDRFARQAMSRDQILESNWAYGLTLLSIGCIVAFFVTGRAHLLLGAASSFGTTLLTSAAFHSHPGRPRRTGFCLAAGFAIIAVLIQYWLFQWRPDPTEKLSQPFAQIFLAFLGSYFLFLGLFATAARISRTVPTT